MGEQATRDYEQKTLQEYVSLGGFTKETSTSMVFSDINMIWSPEQNAFYSEGLLGMSNILDVDLNGAWEGFLEFRTLEDGSSAFDLFLKASAESWYYFSFQDNRLMMFSSNQNFNNEVTKRSNAAKAKIGELVFVPGGRPEALEFINKFRFNYMGIDLPYDLDSEANLNDKEKKKEKTEEDDGF